jgi:hypothetical protein
MDKVMVKHGRMYATTTLLVKGGRRWQASSTNWCDEKLLEVLKIRNGRI